MTAEITPLIMLHLGLGSFHRAHQALYLHQLQQSGDRRWNLAAGNIRPDMPETIAALAQQQGAYTLETVTPQGAYSYTRITSIAQVVAWDAQLKGLIAVGASASTRIISFTVTEAGYYLDATGRLDLAFADLQADLDALHAGRAGSTIYGALCGILRARMHAGAGPVTLLNCDNLRHNGERARSGLLQFIELLEDAALREWVSAHTSNPKSVQAYEEAKIRLLNATHSCIAWAGTLLGYTYIHEGTHDARIRKMAFDYVTDDVIPVLSTPEHPSPIDLAAYRDVVLDRFGNPDIADTNQRVAMDGFSKIPGFIAPTFRERLARGESIASVAMLPALFLAYLQRWHAGQIPYTYQDQAMDPASAHAICEASDPMAAFAADTVLWGDLASDARLLAALRLAYGRVQNFVQGQTV